jgi:hypothetical protein
VPPENRRNPPFPFRNRRQNCSTSVKLPDEIVEVLKDEHPTLSAWGGSAGRLLLMSGFLQRSW